MDRRGNAYYPDFSNWKRPPIDGTGADTSFVQKPPLQVVSTSNKGNLPRRFRDKLATVRNNFVEQRGESKMVKAYEVEQDVPLFKALATEAGTSEYAEAKRSLDAYIDMQLRTHLGERLHVGVSQLHHNIVNGELRVADTDESLLEMLTRGKNYRRKYGKSVDWDREEAEVVGFARIQEVLADPNTPVGTMMYNVTQPGDVKNGTIYKGNFYDVHWKVSGKKVISFRYTSGLTPEESHKRLQVVDSRYQRVTSSTDAEKIANPVKVKPGTKGLENPDAIHDFMHVDHAHMSRQKFAVVMQVCQPLMDDYKQSLRDNPDNLAEHKKRLDILMNYADNIAKELDSIAEGHVVALHDPKGMKNVRPWFPPEIDRNALAQQKVRVVATGCGTSGGESSPFSVAESASGSQYTGENAKDDPNLCRCGGKEPHFHCPGKEGQCGHAIVVGKGISNCPKCGAGQVC